MKQEDDFFGIRRWPWLCRQSPMKALAQTTLQPRVEWQAFKITSQYDSLFRAVRSMKANTNAADPNSWTYWTNIHLNECPHGVAYFLAWHRGYLAYFERQLRSVWGDPSLMLPYWDYYSYATLPAEFTNASSTNPLYVDRIDTHARQALTMTPFSSTLINFPRGMSSAFEPGFGLHDRMLHQSGGARQFWLEIDQALPGAPPYTRSSFRPMTNISFLQACPDK
jgi:hypothetical protein